MTPEISSDFQIPDGLQWSFSAFDKLSNIELYDLLKLRQEVFVVEQECAYPDMDDLDQSAIHYRAFIRSKLVAYARIIPKDKLYKGTVSIGRVIVDQTYRSKGLGRLLMLHCLNFCDQNYSGIPIKITAQTYLEKFYQSLDFNTTSEPYDWDGIMHIDMVRRSDSP